MGVIEQIHAQNVLKEREQHGVMVNAHGKKIAAFNWVNKLKFEIV